MNRIDEAKKIFEEMLAESLHLSPREKSANREWFDNAKRELKKMG